MFERITRALAIARAADWPTCQAQLRSLPDPQAYGIVHALFKILSPAVPRVLTLDFRGLADSRLTAVMVAMRWYAAEHEGKRPSRIEDLVPHYLSTIPADPYASSGVLKYHPDPHDPLVYSVGEDGQDNGGSTRPSPPSPQVVRQRPTEWDLEDYVIHLKRQPRERDETAEEPEPAATEPTTTPATEPS